MDAYISNFAWSRLNFYCYDLPCLPSFTLVSSWPVVHEEVFGQKIFMPIHVTCPLCLDDHYLLTYMLARVH